MKTLPEIRVVFLYKEFNTEKRLGVEVTTAAAAASNGKNCSLDGGQCLRRTDNEGKCRKVFFATVIFASNIHSSTNAFDSFSEYRHTSWQILKAENCRTFKRRNALVIKKQIISYRRD